MERSIERIALKISSSEIAVDIEDAERTVFPYRESCIESERRSARREEIRIDAARIGFIFEMGRIELQRYQSCTRSREIAFGRHHELQVFAASLLIRISCHSSGVEREILCAHERKHPSYDERQRSKE